MRLRFVDEILVPFSGERAGEGPLTLGQLNTLHWTHNMTEGQLRMMPARVDLSGATVDDFCAALAVLLARHEALRTAYLLDAGPIQRVWRCGELPVGRYEIDDESEDARGAAFLELAHALRARDFDLAKDLSVRAAVVTRGGAARFAVLMFSHMAVDYAALATVLHQLKELVGDPARRVVGRRGHQPLDQAAAEQSAAGRRRAEAALRYWERQRRQIPQCLFAMPVQGPDGAPGPVVTTLVSRAAALALPHITARTGSTAPMVVLAALSALLARRIGQRHCPIFSLADNRIGRHMRGYVGTIAQDGLVVVDTGTASFDELIRRTGTATLTAARYSLVDTAAAYATRRRIDHTRGIDLGRDFVFNNTSPYHPAGVRMPERGELAEVRAAVAETHLARGSVALLSSLLEAQLLRLDERLYVRLMCADPRRAPAAEIELLLRGTEALLVAAADGDVDLGRLDEVSGVQPVARDDRWCYVDSCWVELDEIQRLVDEALPGSAARVFVTGRPPAGDPAHAAGDPTVVAYLAAGSGVRTPEQAHDACMAALPGRLTAMAPGRYVVCERPPPDRSDLTAWRRQRVLAQGDGRTG